MIRNSKEFEYFKIVHSTKNPDIKYEGENYIWYSESIYDKIFQKFSNYSPNKLGINYYGDLDLKIK